MGNDRTLARALTDALDGYVGMEHDILDVCEAVLENLGIPAATLQGLRDGTLVAVPREPATQEIAAMEMALAHVLANVSYTMPADGMRRVRDAMLAATQARTP